MSQKTIRRVQGEFLEVCAISSEVLSEVGLEGTQEEGENGAQNSTRRCCDAFHSMRRVGLNTFQACNYCSSSNKGEMISSSGWHVETKENRPEMRKVSCESNENKENRA